ncbi:hypothetical protein MMC24_007254 [Lignoscripta atroalba]|nr:hypothetical protein [Lignoscripta atroalba]
MAPSTAAVLLSPAELSYLHSSLSLAPPLRPDSRSPTQFRPLIAETDILPGTNGSARICFADGTEAIVGVKAEVEKSSPRPSTNANGGLHSGKGTQDDEEMEDAAEVRHDSNELGDLGRRKVDGKGQGENSWVEMTIEIPGFRDDDPLPIFLAAMLNEALLATGELVDSLWINRRFHWKLYIDVRLPFCLYPFLSPRSLDQKTILSTPYIQPLYNFQRHLMLTRTPPPAGKTPQILLLSPPLSYPLPLLSLTTHLALLATRLPALKSELDEDPLFNDDWDASTPLYPRPSTSSSSTSTTPPQHQTHHPTRPPITLLVMAVGPNILFDPSREELAVADAVLAVSFAGTAPSSSGTSSLSTDADSSSSRDPLRLLSIRTIDPPSRLTAPGVPDSMNTATGGSAGVGQVGREEGMDQQEGVWRPPRGGMKRGLVGMVVKMVLEKGGVGEEVLEGLRGVDIG